MQCEFMFFKVSDLNWKSLKIMSFPIKTVHITDLCVCAIVYYYTHVAKVHTGVVYVFVNIIYNYKQQRLQLLKVIFE